MMHFELLDLAMLEDRMERGDSSEIIEREWNGIWEGVGKIIGKEIHGAWRKKVTEKDIKLVSKLYGFEIPKDKLTKEYNSRWNYNLG